MNDRGMNPIVWLPISALFWALVGVAVLWPYETRAQSALQPQPFTAWCGPGEVVDYEMRQRGVVKKVSDHPGAQSTVTEVWESEDGEQWTIVARLQGGMACITGAYIAQ